MQMRSNIQQLQCNLVICKNIRFDTRLTINQWYKLQVIVANMEREPSDAVTDETTEPSPSVILSICQWRPPIWLEKLTTSILTPVLVWLVTFLLVGQDGLPGGQTFTILVLIFFGIATGYAVEIVKFPPLLGMLAVGMAIRNVPGIQYATTLTEEVSSQLRQIALVVILIRAGLGLDPVALAKLSGIVVRLAFGPCLVEAFTLTIASHFILGFPWTWGFLLGFVLAAVSPAVIVPCLLSLRDRHYGVAKGIPTIVIAAASVDDILAISAFGVALGFTLHQNESLSMTILQGPIEVVLGITFGIVWGVALGLFLGQPEQEAKEYTLFRILFTLAGGCIALFGFQYIKFPGSGALGCLTSAFVAATIWRRKGVMDDNDNLNWGFQKLWFIFQPLLFGLIGCEINFYNLDPSIVLLGLLCLIIGLTTRIVTSFYMVANAGLTVKERIFIALAWLPKATVQAAIGPVAYDLARKLNAGADAEKYGLEVLTIAVLSILVTAPVGAIAIMLAGPKLLSLDSADANNGDTKTLATNLTDDSESFIDTKNDKEVTNGGGDVSGIGTNEIRIKMTSVSIVSNPKNFDR